VSPLLQDLLIWANQEPNKKKRSISFHLDWANKEPNKGITNFSYFRAAVGQRCQVWVTHI